MKVTVTLLHEHEPLVLKGEVTVKTPPGWLIVEKAHTVYGRTERQSWLFPSEQIRRVETEDE